MGQSKVPKPKLGERVEVMRKRLQALGRSDIAPFIDKLWDLVQECQRQVNKHSLDPSYTLHFSAGDLRLIATTVRTKLNHHLAKTYYESYAEEPKRLMHYKTLCGQRANIYNMAQKLLALQFALGDIIYSMEVLSKDMIIGFGKYKGQHVSEVAQTKVGEEYLRWLIEQDWISEDLRCNIQEALHM